MIYANLNIVMEAEPAYFLPFYYYGVSWGVSNAMSQWEFDSRPP